MKKRTTYLIYSLWIMSILSLLLVGCKKDDTKNSDNTIKDIDGNVYHTVTIGTQVWTVENLKVTKYNDGAPIPNITDENQWRNLNNGAYCNYENLESYISTYGRLYNWHAVNTGKLAPTGWHVPTESDWEALIAFLGGDGIAGGKLKATGSSWASPNTAATNESGFTGLPGGYRESGGAFSSCGEIGRWWSATNADIYPCSVLLSFDNSVADIEVSFIGAGRSIRCVKD